MAKDTEKLIRQLSLISFLMANRRPVSALADPAPSISSETFTLVSLVLRSTSADLTT